MSELFIGEDLGPRLRQVAETINAEVKLMKLANKRLEARRVTAKPSNKKARPKASLQRARD